MSRRPQSLRPPPRPSVVNPADITQSPDETMSTEDLLRRQLLEKDRENDRLRNKISQLQAELNQRPDRDQVESLHKEYQNLELLLQGTQRENERAMGELDRAKQREKQLEQELAKLAGPNWKSSLDLVSSPLGSRPNLRSNPSLTNAISSSPVTSPVVNGPSATEAAEQAKQVRLLVLGMQQRLEAREDKLEQSIRRAEAEAAKFEQMRREILAAPGVE